MVYLVGPGWTLVMWDGHRAEVHDLTRSRSFVMDGRLGQRLHTWLAQRADEDGGSDVGTDEVLAALVRMHEATPQGETLAELLASPHVERAEAARLLARQRLSVCFIELTAQCNERCTHCYAGSSPEVTTALSRETLEEVVREAHAAGFPRLQFTGGDPLISPHLVPLVRLARDLGVANLEVYTNALALHQSLLHQLLDCGCTFAVSLYSHDAATHDAITQTWMSHARTVANVKRAVAVGAQVRVSVILMEANRGQLAETLAFVRDELGVPASQIGVDVVHEVGRGRSVSGLNEEAAAVTAAMPTHTGLPETPGEQANPLERWWQGKVAVAPDGEVYPCIFSRFLSLGNVGQRPLRKILAAPAITVDRAVQDDIALLDTPGLWQYLGERLRCIDCRLGSAAMLLTQQAEATHRHPVRP